MAASTIVTTQLLLDLYGRGGAQTATIYLPTVSDRTDAEERLVIRSKNATRALETQGASDALVAVVDTALAAVDHSDGTALLLVADEAGIQLQHSMVRPISHPLTHVGPCPLLMPMIAAVQPDRKHLAVLLDRTGADLYLRGSVGAPIETKTVEGDRDDIQKAHPGGWSNHRFPQAAEEAWEKNAKQVVEQMLADYSDVEQIIAGGETRMVGFLDEHIPERLRPLVVVEASRHADPDAFLDAADLALRDLAAGELAEEIRVMNDSIGIDMGAAGQDVLQALVSGRVDKLYVGNDSLEADRVTARFDFSQHQVVTSGGVEAPVTDGAIALAMATGAEVTVLPSTARGLVDGLAARYRY